jgi:hypothetical protein
LRFLLGMEGNCSSRLRGAVFHVLLQRTSRPLEPSFTVASRFVPKPTRYETNRARGGLAVIVAIVSVVTRFAGVCALAVIISVTVLGQRADIPNWAGTWELGVQESSFGKILFPGAPVDFALLTQRTKLEQATDKLKMSADIVYSDANGPHKVHEESSLSLDGRRRSLALVLSPSGELMIRLSTSSVD